MDPYLLLVGGAIFWETHLATLRVKPEFSIFHKFFHVGIRVWNLVDKQFMIILHMPIKTQNIFKIFTLKKITKKWGYIELVCLE
jgi:hypothetical protein